MVIKKTRWRLLVVSMCRWHLPDPIAWRDKCRITIQQIAYKGGLLETEDDWCCAPFWYEPPPSGPIPAMPDVKARTADIWPVAEPKR